MKRGIPPHRIRMTCTALVFLARFVPMAFAFEELPEYGGITLRDGAAFDDPTLIDAEYSSDYATYQKPFDWEYDWLVHTQELEFSVGSLAPRKFLVHNRLKIDQQVGDDWRIRFFYLADESLEEQEVRHIVELVYMPGPWGVALYGGPTFEKKEDSAGLALLWHPSGTHRLRLFCGLYELDHAKREDGGPYTPEDKLLPMSMGLVGSMHSPPSSGKREYLTYAFRYEPPSYRIWTDARYAHEYSRVHASVAFQKEFPGRHRLAGRVRYDDKIESRETPDPLTAVQVEEWRGRRVLTELQYSAPFAEYELAPLVACYYRDWQMPEDDVVFWDVVPQLWFRFPEKGNPGFRRRWSVCYEYTQRIGDDTTHLFGEDAPEDIRGEHRLNLRHDMVFGDRGTLSLQYTFDLDALDSEEPWEGGNGQLRLFF